MNKLKNDIKKFILKEINTISKPNNPGQVYSFDNLSFKIDILFKLLEYEISDESINRVSDNFFIHCEKILNFELKELPIAIEGLATNFESFLKLIGFLRYGETKLWSGDGEYSVGLKKTTLFNLLSSKIDNTYNSPKDVQLKHLPDPLVENTGIQYSILSYLRTNLRNSVHDAKTYRRIDLVYNSNLVLSCYLFAIESNFDFLKTLLIPEYIYLQKILKDQAYIDLNKVYIDILGEENFNEIDVLFTELKNENNLLFEINRFNSFSQAENYEDIETYENETNISDSENVRIDTIVKIASEINSFIIIGSPGSGKSTSLRKILYNNASLILKGDKNVKFPILLNANEYRSNNNFKDSLYKIINKEWIDHNLESGNILLLIDGLNEVIEKYKFEAINEIKQFLIDFKNINIIISERKLNFEKKFDLPVYELKELDENQIKLFIKNYSEIHYESIWAELSNNDNMLQLAHSPLMLKMILSVSQKGTIPINRGLLYQVFINLIFKREKSKQYQTNTNLKIDVLSDLAFKMRLKGSVSWTSSYFKDELKSSLQKNNSIVSVNDLIEEFQDNLIIKKNQNDNISFYHETYQEYFCALEIKKIFEISKNFNFNIYEDKWNEALLLCSEIIKDEDLTISFFNYVFKGDVKTNNQKKILEFDSNDFNNNLVIACKIAFSLKNINPAIYEIAEKYVNNYLIIWKIYYYKKGVSIIPLSEIFSAIAILDSKKLISKILFSHSWVFLWLFSKNEIVNDDLKYVENKLNITDLDDCEVENLIYAISKYASNFSTVFEILKISIEKYSIINSIFTKLQKISDFLINYQPDYQLKNYLLSNFDFQIFLKLLVSDIRIIDLYIFNNSYENDKTVIYLLIRYHINDEKIQSIINSELTSNKYKPKIINLYINQLYTKSIFKPFFVILEYLMENNEELFIHHIPKLQSLSLTNISKKINYYFNSKISKLSYVIPYINLNTEKNILYTDEKFYNLFDLNKIYSINDKIPILIKNNNLEKTNKILVVEKDFVGEFTGRENNGDLKIIKNNHLTLYVKYESYSVKKEKFYFILNIKDDLPDDFKYITLKEKGNVKIIVNESFAFTFFQWHYKMNVSVNFEKLSSNLLPINGDLIYEKEKLNLDLFKPHFYHPELIKKSVSLSTFLLSKINNSATQSFIKNVGLTHFYLSNIIDTHFGIVVLINKKNVRIYSLIKKKILDFELPIELLSELKYEDIVVIESNFSIKRISNEIFISDYFNQSIIVGVNQEKKEGFIKKIDSSNNKDIYFQFKNCDFEPKYGDSVRFIISLNTSPNYQNESVAVKISKINRPKCKIVKLEQSQTNFHKLTIGEAIDLDSNEGLSFRLHDDKFKYIIDYEGPVTIGSIFEYTVLFKNENNSSKFIFFNKMISKS